ncbi:MAG: molybdenum cofactor guanylyltransferase [Fusobacteriaceae bacterium]
MNKINNIDALILAGGQSSRMNFSDKALLKFDKNRTFLDKISAELEDFENLMVSVNKNQNFLIPRGIIVTDSVQNAGPIEGIYRGLLNSKSDFIFVTTCDMPNINKDFVNFVLQFNSKDYDAIIIRDKNGKTYPLFGIYNKSSLSTFEGFILDKNYRLQEVLTELNVKYISLENTNFNSHKLLKSIDTIDELKMNSLFIDNTAFINVYCDEISDSKILFGNLVKHFKDAGFKANFFEHDSEYDLEILLKEFDIILLENWATDCFSKVKISKDTLSAFKEILKITGL